MATRAKHRPRIAASNSYTPGEIKLWRHILKKLPTMPGQRVIVRHPEYASLCRKAQNMEAKVEEMERARALEDRAAELAEDAGGD